MRIVKCPKCGKAMSSDTSHCDCGWRYFDPDFDYRRMVPKNYLEQAKQAQDPIEFKTRVYGDFIPNTTAKGGKQ